MFDDERILDVANWGKDPIFFMGDPGERQMIRGFHAAGTEGGYRAAITPIAKYPRVRLVHYAAFVPPLLRIVGAPNFIVDVAHPSSEGKTTTLRTAAAVWGKPDEKYNGAMHTFEKTQVAIERGLGVMNDLPTILDDTKLCRYPQMIPKILYMVHSGQGRGRGTRTGLATIQHFRSVLITSGEAPITSFSEDGGTRARTLELWGPPLERADETTENDVRIFNTELRLHYGHAGPRFVRYLISNHDRWADIKDLYREREAGYVSASKGHPVAGRLAAYFGAIDTAAYLAHEALDMPWSYSDPIDPLWEALVSEAKDADRAQIALSHVHGWAMRNQHAFHGRERFDVQSNPIPPPGGWAGRWDAGEDHWEFVAFYKDQLRRLLKEFDSEYSVVKTWKDRGWLDAYKNRLDKQTRVPGGKPEMVRIRREALLREEGAEDG